MKLNPLDEVRSGQVLAILFGVFFLLLPVVAVVLLNTLGEEPPQGLLFTLENLLATLSYILIGGLLWLTSRAYHDELAQLMLDLPDPAQRREYLWLGLVMVISAIGFVYLFFYPLSLIVPDFVKYWLLDAPYLLYWDQENSYLLGNFLGVLMAVLLAPVVEEVLFRGYLLNRWTLKMGAWQAAILSSALFAVLHTDILGAFVFALVMSLLYMKTRTLVAPIIVHMSNNLIAVTLEWLDRSFWTGFEVLSVSDFQGTLWLGLICMLIGFPWLWLYVKANFKPLPGVVAAHENGTADKPRV